MSAWTFFLLLLFYFWYGNILYCMWCQMRKKNPGHLEILFPWKQILLTQQLTNNYIITYLHRFYSLILLRNVDYSTNLLYIFLVLYIHFFHFKHVWSLTRSAMHMKWMYKLIEPLLRYINQSFQIPFLICFCPFHWSLWNKSNRETLNRI